MAGKLICINDLFKPFDQLNDKCFDGCTAIKMPDPKKLIFKPLEESKKDALEALGNCLKISKK